MPESLGSFKYSLELTVDEFHWLAPSKFLTRCGKPSRDFAGAEDFQKDVDGFQDGALLIHGFEGSRTPLRIAKNLFKREFVLRSVERAMVALPVVRRQCPERPRLRRPRRLQ